MLSKEQAKKYAIIFVGILEKGFPVASAISFDRGAKPNTVVPDGIVYPMLGGTVLSAVAHAIKLASGDKDKKHIIVDLIANMLMGVSVSFMLFGSAQELNKTPAAMLGLGAPTAFGLMIALTLVGLSLKLAEIDKPQIFLVGAISGFAGSVGFEVLKTVYQFNAYLAGAAAGFIGNTFIGIIKSALAVRALAQSTQVPLSALEDSLVSKSTVPVCIFKASSRSDVSDVDEVNKKVNGSFPKK